MNKLGPIVVVEDDGDDREILSLVFTELNCPNEIVFFHDGVTALHYLRSESVRPFLVFSDINLPVISGIELRKIIQEDELLNAKCVPFIMFSTHMDSGQLNDCYRNSVQGFFQKPFRYEDQKELIHTIVRYWQKSYSPQWALEFVA